MNIYQLKAIIKGLEVTNLPSDKYLLEFYSSLYQEQLDQIANKVQDQLDQEQKNELYYKSKAWNEYLAK
jgi:hypothetical protein